MTTPAAASTVHTELKHISLELTNICNLHCSYCARDDDALYHSPANFFSVELLRRIIRSASQASCGFNSVSFTGGEVTIHPRFKEIVEVVREEGWQFGFVTNGWHFDRVYPTLLANRDALHMVAFSLDGPTRETHDRWRGEGSFVRVMRAITRCYMKGIPFLIKTGIRRDTIPLLEQFALLAARLGAQAIHFSHLLPTSSGAETESGLSLEERAHVEQEIGVLSNIFKMKIGVATGYYNLDPAPPCQALEGTNCNIDYRGRLTLCCNLSGYRGASEETDVVADLNTEDFANGFARLRQVAADQLERRRLALAEIERQGTEPDLYTASPCLYCLQSFGKIPWHKPAAAMANSRSLPVLSISAPAAPPSVYLKQESI
ncbi:MAG TPA: radical SAM protein [Pyrinomonadaceae bacterium]|nr:radical SAM protein [Pyrinomonadaceae bacterium]